MLIICTNAENIFPVNEVIQFEKITEIAERVLTWTRAEDRKERSFLRLARRHILPTLFEEHEVEEEEGVAVEGRNN